MTKINNQLDYTNIMIILMHTRHKKYKITIINIYYHLDRITELVNQHSKLVLLHIVNLESRKLLILANLLKKQKIQKVLEALDLANSMVLIL